MRLLLTILLLLILNPAKADFLWTPRCLEAYEAVFDLNFSKAARLLAEEKSENPKNLVPVFIENESDFIKTFISEEDNAFNSLKKNTEVRIGLLEKSKAHKCKNLFIGEMYLQLAIGRLKFDEFFSAGYDIRKANKLLEQNQKEYPKFAANLRGLGFIHTLAGTVPKNYQWISNILGVSGTVKQGLGELEFLLEKTQSDPELSYLHSETVLMLTFLELTLDKKEQNNARIRGRFIAVKQIDRKPLLQFAKAVFHISLAENDSVINLLSTRRQDPAAFPLYYLDYMEGAARMNKLDLSADKCFDKYLRNYKGRSYVYAAWQRRAWLKMLQNDVAGYKLMMKHCIIDSKDDDGITDEDKQAIHSAKNGEVPNLILLKCRLLFDGGYYNSALNTIAGQPATAFPTQQEQLELTYRLARIFDKTGNKEKAIYYYVETYQNGQSTTYYFSANSALMLGRLYEESGNNQKALEFYKKALALKNHEFQNSIDQKAKAGISRLE